MNLTVLAGVELVLLVGAAIASARLVARVGRGARPLVVTAAVAVWLLVFGMVPFFVFAVALPAGRAGHPGAGLFETTVLNLVPLALVASPFVGAAQGLALTSKARRR